jgi:hypothetical protein
MSKKYRIKINTTPLILEHTQRYGLVYGIEEREHMKHLDEAFNTKITGTNIQPFNKYTRPYYVWRMLPLL